MAVVCTSEHRVNDQKFIMPLSSLVPINPMTYKDFDNLFMYHTKAVWSAHIRGNTEVCLPDEGSRS